MTPYTKLNSQGNDFILVEASNLETKLSLKEIVKYSSRDNIGCDQFFVIDTADKENIFCEVYNQDGSKACQCGNGLRATMLYLNIKYNLEKTNLIVCDAVYRSKMINGLISINMGTPKYIERLAQNSINGYSISKNGIVITLQALDNELKFSFVPLSIGNNHCVVFSDNCIQHKEEISKTLQKIYNGIMNVGFVENTKDFLTNNNTIVKLTVNERGAGYTESCGSGATAAAICLFKLFELDNETKVNQSKIKIEQKGGLLEIVKNYNPDTFELIGPSSYDGDGYLEH